MRVRRGLLFWGLLLIPLGAIPLLVRAGQLDPARLADAWRLWPLIIVGVGLLILASRTRLAVVGSIVLALTIGSIGGAALASGNIWLGPLSVCGLSSSTTTALDRTGSFDGPATVRLALDCGSLDLTAGSDATWSVHAQYRGDPPTLDAAGGRLDLRSPNGGTHREDWTIAVPAASLRTFELTANAAASTIDLGSAGLDQLTATVNAGDVRITGGSATLANVDVTMNAGRLRLTLGSGATHGTLSANAGAIDLCVPADATLRFDVDDQLTFGNNLSSRGLAHSGTVWTRTGTGPQTIDLAVSGNAASFNLDPNGGC
jgi:hypothetical protein